MSEIRVAPVEFDDADYTKYRRGLLKRKGSSRQVEFLNKLRKKEMFIEELDGIKSVGSAEIKLIPTPLTEAEYKDPPIDTEEALYSAWPCLAPSMACRSTFWARLTLEHIRHSRIQHVYLAANGGSLPGGAERIDQALQAHSNGTKKAADLVDSCVRTILRRLGGLPEARGARSVYVDCPFARAWWRERMVTEAASGNEEFKHCARAALRVNQTYWEKFIDRVISRNSTFGSRSVRSSFIRVLGQELATNPNSELFESSSLQRLCRQASTYQGRRELGIIREDVLDELFVSLIERFGTC